MTEKISKMIDMVKKMEVETIEKGETMIMKVFAIEESGQTTIVAFADYIPEKRDFIMGGLGVKLKQVLKSKLESLILVSDSYFTKLPSKEEEMSIAEKVIMSDLESGKRRLEHMPESYSKWRKEALVIVISTNEGREITTTMFPHHKDGGKVIIEEPETVTGHVEDNMLSSVWKGYLT